MAALSVVKQTQCPWHNRSLQALPWNNDSTIEQMDDCNWCCQITNIVQYIHAWNQRYIIELLQLEWRTDSVLLKKKRWLQVFVSKKHSTLEKTTTLQVASLIIGGTIQMHDCKWSSEITICLG